jgi:hypothetical protein
MAVVGLASTLAPRTDALAMPAPRQRDLIKVENEKFTGADGICSDEKHWIFAEMGMKDGDSIPGRVGWEWMGAPADTAGLPVVGRGKITQKGVIEEYTATIYPSPKENIVFNNAATCWWADGLSKPPGYKHPAYYVYTSLLDQLAAFAWLVKWFVAGSSPLGEPDDRERIFRPTS